jgi:hypothetical protein
MAVVQKAQPSVSKFPIKQNMGLAESKYLSDQIKSD